MLALRKTAPSHGLNLEDVEEPCDLEPDEVLVEVAAVGICGSDLHVYDWGANYEFMRERLPVTLGHEFSGRVVNIGADVSSSKIGDLVAIIPSTSCMRCEHCLAGYPQRCMQRSTVGLTRDGAFARYVRVPSISCIRLPENIDMALAALMEPLSVGDNAAQIGAVSMGDTVVVLGPGTIGQAIARCARWRGASRVIVVGKGDESRLKTALQVGATHTIDLDETSDLRSAVMACTGNRLADVVLEATGRASSIGDGLGLLRKEGVLVCAGIHAEQAVFDVTSLVRNRQQIRGAHASRRSSWHAVAHRIANEPDSVRAMISREMPLSDGLVGFDLCRNREVSKVILRP